METKDLYSLNSDLLHELPIEELEERLELEGICWSVCYTNIICDTLTPST